jgi:hypothetical protein
VRTFLNGAVWRKCHGYKIGYKRFWQNRPDDSKGISEKPECGIDGDKRSDGYRHHGPFIETGLTVSEVNEGLKCASEGSLSVILGYCSEALVSSDFNGSPLSSIVDAGTTHVMGQMVKVLAWYDNETGYANRMVDLAAMIGKQR